MKTEKIIETKKEIITEIVCDCCGKSCKVNEGVINNDSRLDNGEPYFEFSYANIEVFWGYNSNKDGQKWLAQICEKCIDEKFSFVNFTKPLKASKIST